MIMVKGSIDFEMTLICEERDSDKLCILRLETMVLGHRKTGQTCVACPV